MLEKMNKVLMILAIGTFFGLGVAANAQATASYAISYDNLWDFSIASEPGGGDYNVATDRYTSRDSADLGPFGNPSIISDIDTNITPPNPPGADADRQNLGTAVGASENAFTPLGQNGIYGTGDALISFPGILDNPTNIAESYVTCPNPLYGLGASGSGNGFNSLSQDFTITTDATVLDFSFYADPYMKVEVDNSDGSGQPGSDAVANLGMSITITDVLGNTVFGWAPDGAAGGITGGTELLDPFDLNTELFATLGNPGPKVYDPTGDATFGGGIGSGGFFSAKTLQLAPGDYTLSASMNESVTTNISNAPIPEPGTMLLLGAGLIGLAGFGRKKFKK